MGRPVTNTAFNVFPYQNTLFNVMITDDLGKFDYIASFMDEKHAKMFAEQVEKEINDPTVVVRVFKGDTEDQVAEFLPGVIVDHDLCIGCGVCASILDKFILNDDNKAEFTGQVTAKDEESIDKSIESCPVNAISRS